MLESKTRTIKGRTYEVTQLPAFQGLDLLENVGILIGPALGALAKNGVTGQVDFEAAAVRLFAGLGGGKLRALTKELLKTTTVQLEGGKTPQVLEVFDAIFAGKLAEALEVLAFAFEVLCGDFFDAAKSAIAELLAAPAESGSNSPTA